jgi:3-oxoacyl-[acyl-carrier-protein] synthase-3
MDGRKVYTFAVRVVCDTIRELLHMEGAGVDDVTYIVPHQANARILDAAAKRLKIPREKFYMNINEFANTSAASIPIALCEMERKKLLTRGDLLLTVGFGGGLTYGGNIMYW